MKKLVIEGNDVYEIDEDHYISVADVLNSGRATEFLRAVKAFTAT